MAITDPAESANFQVAWNDPEHKLESLQHVTIDIDDNNPSEDHPTSPC